MSDVLIKTLSLKDLNIANNQMETKSALSIAHGLSHTQTLEHIDISGNPVGKYGLRLLLQSMSNNKDTRFQINMKDISADKEVKLVRDPKDCTLNFDLNNMEGQYTLDLEEAFS